MSAPESARAVELTTLEKDPRRRPPPPKRGEITGFSRASRRRLLWRLAEIDETAMQSALFVTLTYPADDPRAEDRTSHLDTLLKRLRRKAPEASAIWKLEYTKKGTPHYHLIIFGLNFWHHAEIAKAWSQIVNSENEHHEKAGTQVRKVQAIKRVARYVVKYLSKPGTIPESHKGKVWGCHGALKLARSPRKLYILTRDAWKGLRRLCDRIRLSHKRNTPFPRASNPYNSQRWFLSGSEIIRYCTALGYQPLSESGP